MQPALPLIPYFRIHNKMLIRNLSYTGAFLMFQAFKLYSLRGAVIDCLNFFFHATPLIHNRLNRLFSRSIFSAATDYPPQKRLCMKTKLAGLICLFVLSAQMHVLADSGSVTVNEKLIKAFQDAFPTAEKVYWNQEGDHYFVHFKDHEVTSLIEYDYDGNFLASERYYQDADLLPLQLSWELHKKYSGKTIYGITEINTETETVYFVKLQDAKEWITVKGASYGTLGVVERFNKQ